MKTNKHQTLLLVQVKQAVRAKDLVQAFGYSAPTARSYLSHLKRQDLLERIVAGHALTEKGRTRLQFFDVGGCTDPVCPLCQPKTGCITCPLCTYQMPHTEARILPTQDFLVLVACNS
jgi:predicted methyltransferase